MITGDNSLTAISVARSLAMTRSPSVQLIDQHTMTIVTKKSIGKAQDLNWDQVFAENWDIALTGNAFESVLRSGDPILKKQVVERCSVYARTTPLQKADIIAALKSTGHTVAMVGDGANDSGKSWSFFFFLSEMCIHSY